MNTVDVDGVRREINEIVYFKESAARERFTFSHEIIAFQEMLDKKPYVQTKDARSL